MKKEIAISVHDRVAVQTGGPRAIVSDNTDYVVRLTFDEEWAAYDTKTVLFVRDDGTCYPPVVADKSTTVGSPTADTGEVECALPRINGTGHIRIGVTAGDICTSTAVTTSTAAELLVIPSVLEIAGQVIEVAPTAPVEVWNWVLEKLSEIEQSNIKPEQIAAAVEEYLTENPIDAEEIGAVSADQGEENAGKILGIDASGEVVPVDAVDMASGGEEVWVPLVDITLEEETNIIDTGTFPTPQKKIRVELNTLAAETNTNYMPVTIPTGDDGSTAFSAIKFYPAPMPITTAARSFYEIECIGDETVVVGVYYSGNTTGFDTGIARLQEFVGAAKTTLSQIDAYGNRYQNQITGFKVLTYAKFAVGTQLKIWGVVK